MDTGGHDYSAFKRGCVALFFILLLALAIVIPRLARADYDGPTTPEIKAWFRTVQNAVGEYCCDGSEVSHVSDYQWRGDHFDVIVDGVTYRVPPKAVSKEVNRLGDGLVWWYPKDATRDEKSLRCFLRGTEG